MRACGEEIENGYERVRGERRGRLQCGADIPAMDGEFKETSVSQRVHGDNAHSMIAGFVPILCVEGDEKMMELLPGLTEHGRQVVAKTPSVRDRSLCGCHHPLPPFLLRVCFEEAWIRGAFRGRGIPLQCTGDAVRVTINHRGKMRHDITDFPEGTGAGLGPGVRWQSGKVLLQPLGLGLDDFDTFCLCGHGVSLLAGACRTN